jgi:hypothetical protein
MRRQPWHHQLWVRSYEYAVLEVDRSKLPDRIQVAETAISARLLVLIESHDLEEPNALREALRVLKLIGEHARWIKGAA